MRAQGRSKRQPYCGMASELQERWPTARSLIAAPWARFDVALSRASVFISHGQPHEKREPVVTGGHTEDSTRVHPSHLGHGENARRPTDPESRLHALFRWMARDTVPTLWSPHENKTWRNEESELRGGVEWLS